MLSSTPNALRFLLDENVRRELLIFLKSKGFDVETLPKGVPDSLLVSKSKRERRILITNDKDFSLYAEKDIFSVVLLKIPQKEADTLTRQFEKLLTECTEFEKHLIILRSDAWEEVLLE